MEITRPGVEVELVFDRLLQAPDLQQVQDFVQSATGSWADGLTVQLFEDDLRPVDVLQPGSLFEEVFAAVTWRGELFRELTKDRPDADRVSGDAYLIGSTSDLDLFVSMNERPYVLMLTGRTLLFNSINFHLLTPEFDGWPAHEWVETALIELTPRLGPVWATVYMNVEYVAKVVAQKPSIEAVGRDFGNFLPGLFWCNYFGPPYVDLIGADKLLSAPAETSRLGEGIVVKLPGLPDDWDKDSGKQAESKVLDHVGREFFFDMADRDRVTLGPDWAAVTGA